MLKPQFRLSHKIVRIAILTGLAAAGTAWAQFTQSPLPYAYTALGACRT